MVVMEPFLEGLAIFCIVERAVIGTAKNTTSRNHPHHACG